MNVLRCDPFVIDARVCHAHGRDDPQAGGVNAASITVCNFESDFEQACDLSLAVADGRAGVIMGGQNSRSPGDRLHLFRAPV